MRILILVGGALLISTTMSALGVEHIAWHILAGVLWGAFYAVVD